MKKEEIVKFTNLFDKIRHQKTLKNKATVEFWYARDLQNLLGYSKWENFFNIISKAKIACEASKHNVSDHFPDVRKMVAIGLNTGREIDDIILTRYACYLIAQNGDPKKEAIAFAQSYFAIQTRKQELLEQRLKLQERLKARKKLTQSEKELSSNIYQRGVDEKGFANIRAKGDTALFGGINTNKMKERLGVKSTRALADFLPTITIKAKDFATEITNFNINKEDMKGEGKISTEHVRNNKEVRATLIRTGIYPEKLPAEEDLQKVERKLNADGKKIGNSKFVQGEVE